MEAMSSDNPTPYSVNHDSSMPIALDASTRNRPKKFRSAWLMFDVFKDWLRPHPSPVLAVCVVCKRVIRAGKSELEKHAAGKKHVRNLKSYYLNRGMFEKEKELMESIDFRLLDSLPDISTNPDDEFIVPTLTPNSCPEACCRTKCEATVLKRAPKWSGTAVINGLIRQLKLDDYKGKFLVFIFYSQDFQSVSASEINRLSDRLSEFQSINAELVACSTDSHLSHLTWTRMSRTKGGVQNITFPLLSDTTRVIASDYGVYLPEEGHCLSAHFIIDCEGILRHMSIYDPVIGKGTNELLRLVRSCQRSLESEDYIDIDWYGAEA